MAFIAILAIKTLLSGSKKDAVDKHIQIYVDNFRSLGLEVVVQGKIVIVGTVAHGDYAVVFVRNFKDSSDFRPFLAWGSQLYAGKVLDYRGDIKPDRGASIGDAATTAAWVKETTLPGDKADAKFPSFGAVIRNPAGPPNMASLLADDIVHRVFGEQFKGGRRVWNMPGNIGSTGVIPGYIFYVSVSPMRFALGVPGGPKYEITDLNDHSFQKALERKTPLISWV